MTLLRSAPTAVAILMAFSVAQPTVIYGKHGKQNAQKILSNEGIEYMKYPELVTKLTTLCSGWLVGSSANWTVKEPRDYDVYIPIKYWAEASNFIPRDAKINRMGGFKCLSEGIEVDVWTGDVNDFLASNYFTFAYHPMSGVRISRVYQPLPLDSPSHFVTQ